MSCCLRLGAKICEPHLCNVCGLPVDSLGRHGLSCKYSAGTKPRHLNMNETLQGSLSTINIRIDNKRADGVTNVPWSKERALVWHATCADSFSKSFLKSVLS